VPIITCLSCLTKKQAPGNLARKVERWGRHTYSDMMIRTIIYVPCHVNAGTDNWRVKIEGDTHSSIEGDTHTSLRETHIHHWGRHTYIKRHTCIKTQTYLESMCCIYHYEDTCNDTCTVTHERRQQELAAQRWGTPGCSTTGYRRANLRLLSWGAGLWKIVATCTHRRESSQTNANLVQRTS